jgi:hypothetical protein
MTDFIFASANRQRWRLVETQNAIRHSRPRERGTSGECRESMPEPGRNQKSDEGLNALIRKAGRHHQILDHLARIHDPCRTKRSFDAAHQVDRLGRWPLLFARLLGSGIYEVIVDRSDYRLQPGPVICNGLENYGAAMPPDADFIGIEAEFLGQASPDFKSPCPDS